MVHISCFFSIKLCTAGNHDVPILLQPVSSVYVLFHRWNKASVLLPPTNCLTPALAIETVSEEIPWQFSGLSTAFSFCSQSYIVTAIKCWWITLGIRTEKQSNFPAYLCISGCQGQSPLKGKSIQFLNSCSVLQHC